VGKWERVGIGMVEEKKRKIESEWKREEKIKK